MHVVATNIIIWIRTLIKESLEEIEEYEVRLIIVYLKFFIIFGEKKTVTWNGNS